MPTKYTFIRRLRRELTASPKKAAMLGLLLLVAVWFWAPLVGKWMGRKDDETPLTATTETATVTAEPMSTTATTIAPTVTLKQEAKSTWQQVLTWMRSDPKMKPHDPKLGGRDPFAPVAERLAAFNQRATEAPIEPTLTPQQAGLSVQSIAVGSHAKTALINGRPYHEQQAVAGSNGQDRFVVVEIRQRSVVLERNGDRFELKIRQVEAAAIDD